MKFIISAFFILFLAACSSNPATENSVKVTNLRGNSGGSGVIISSSRLSSKILTNAHVCRVISRGGLVITEEGNKYFVVSYKVSNNHDLCLITVYANLHRRTHLKSTPPAPFDVTVVSGHPTLLPTIVDRGHLSGREHAEIMIDVRACTQADAQDPETALLCALLGAVPITRVYELSVTSNLIQPGSSGSPVLTESGTLQGVVFAGRGDLSYGMIVPYEYVASFLTKEVDTLPETNPTADSRYRAYETRVDKKTFMQKLESLCVTNEQLKEICEKYNNSNIILNDLILR